MKLIDKDLLIKEIKERIQKIVDMPHYTFGIFGKRSGYEDILSFLDTLEVKEVDLDESSRHYLLHEHISQLNEILHQADLKVEMQYHKDIECAYKAGFKLGLKAQKGGKE